MSSNVHSPRSSSSSPFSTSTQSACLSRVDFDRGLTALARHLVNGDILLNHAGLSEWLRRPSRESAVKTRWKEQPERVLFTEITHECGDGVGGGGGGGVGAGATNALGAVFGRSEHATKVEQRNEIMYTPEHFWEIDGKACVLGYGLYAIHGSFSNVAQIAHSQLEVSPTELVHVNNLEVAVSKFVALSCDDGHVEMVDVILERRGAMIGTITRFGPNLKMFEHSNYVIDCEMGTVHMLWRNIQQCPFCATRGEVCWCTEAMRSRRMRRVVGAPAHTLWDGIVSMQSRPEQGDRQVQCGQADRLLDGNHRQLIPVRRNIALGESSTDHRGLKYLFVRWLNEKYSPEISNESRLVVSSQLLEPMSTTTARRIPVMELVEPETPEACSPQGSLIGKPKLSCPHCTKSFSRRWNLVRHIRFVHEGMRPFECQICDMRFNQRANRDRHVQTQHFKIKLYKCGLCGAPFSSKHNHDRHMNSLHNLPPPPGASDHTTALSMYR